MSLLDILRALERDFDSLFDDTKKDFLGTVDKYLSISGIIESAAQAEGGIPLYEEIESAIKTSSNYIDSVKANFKAKLQAALRGYNKAPIDPPKFSKEIRELFNNAKFQLERVIDTETQHAKSIGLLNGIVRMNTFHGVEDPTVCFITVKDQLVCEECKRLHLLDDGVTPRLWKLSELKHSYHRRNDNYPSIMGEHPFERCQMTTILPGFGFNAGGSIIWVKENFDALVDQRG